MAETAGTQSADALSSPGNVNGIHHPWEQSVPIEQDAYANPYPSKSRTSHDSTSTHPRHGQKHNFSFPINGRSLSRDSSMSGSRQHVHDQTYLNPNRGLRENSLSRAGSEADSILDLYGRDSRNRSATSVVDSMDRKENRVLSVDEEDEHANWIHRDKLAKIESEELQQLGIRLHHPMLLRDESSHQRGQSRDSHRNASNGEFEHVDRSSEAFEGKNSRVTSPTPMGYVQDKVIDDDEPVVFDDPRLPEEIAADEEYRSRVYQMPGLRKSSSRIPVMSSSPHPIPLNHLEREVPMQRTRNNTLNSRDDENLPYTRTRRPSESASQTLGTPEPSVETTPPHSTQTSSSNPQAQPPSSPTKSKTPPTRPPTNRKTSGTAGNRRTSGPQKKPGASSSTWNQRPVTRSGENRPQTAVNRPEGDPPWLATMYKPDPRLPPDQQILPTHAKKILQEQWERDGKIPSTYDRNFAPLAIRQDDDNLPRSPQEQEKPQEQHPPPTFPTPLSPIKSPEPPASRPGTSGTDRGAYRTIPAIRPPSRSNTAKINKPTPAPMVVEDSPSGKKEKGCGCCIVM